MNVLYSYDLNNYVCVYKALYGIKFISFLCCHLLLSVVSVLSIFIIPTVPQTDSVHWLMSHGWLFATALCIYINIVISYVNTIIFYVNSVTSTSFISSFGTTS